MEQGDLFPVRMLGFGFYWAWLFLTCVSPSLLFGRQLILSLPLEAAELIVRLVFIVAIIVFALKVRPNNAVRVLLLVSLVSGIAASALLIFDHGGFTIPMVILMGATDASMFMLWLCFFGNEKVGQVAVFLAASYSFGAILTLFIAALPFSVACVCLPALPLLSCITFQLSTRRYVSDGEPFSVSLVTDEPYLFRVFPFVSRICIAIGLYALVFGLTTSVIFANSIEIAWSGPAIEAPCCLALGAGLALLFWKVKDAQAVYRGYQCVPLVFALGVVLLLISGQIALVIGCSLVMLGYLLFEILALNDLCNAVKLNGLSPVRVFGVMRLAITSGMLAGWLIGDASASLSSNLPPLSFIAAISIPAITIAATLVFTEKEVFAVRSATQERLLIESEPAKADGSIAKEAVLQEAAAIETEFIKAFGQKWQLSKREMDVLPLLLEGKTAVYISEELFIAPGTVKTHVYNIYQKLNIHSKMEMLDAYRAFRDSQ